jgi:hypothetical protein
VSSVQSYTPPAPPAPTTIADALARYNLTVDGVQENVRAIIQTPGCEYDQDDYIMVGYDDVHDVCMAFAALNRLAERLERVVELARRECAPYMRPTVRSVIDTMCDSAMAELVHELARFDGLPDA